MGSASGSRMPQGAERGSASLCQWRRRYPRSRRLPQILVIDDDPGLLSVCSVGLQALGHVVSTAETGSEGLTQAAIHPPQATLPTLPLPSAAGLEVSHPTQTRRASP